MKYSPMIFAQVAGGVDATELALTAARFPMSGVSNPLQAYDHLAAVVFAQR
jgi:hypothetical protein